MPQNRERQRCGCGCAANPGPQAGPPQFCKCPACGEKVPHQRGIPCREMTCPKCGATLVREDAPGPGPRP